MTAAERANLFAQVLRCGAMVDYTLDGHLAVLTINRPEARNAVNGDVAEAMEAAIDRLEGDDDAWVGILTGARTEKGHIFSAGADPKAINAGEAAGLQTERGGFAGLVRRDRTKPLIAAVDGPALAGGTEIVLACDLVVASRTAVFGVPEVKRALIAGAGALFRMPRKLPRAIAMELALTGDPFPAERAHHFGMVNELCEEGEALSTARTLGERICANAPLAVRESRQVMLASTDADDEVGWRLSTEGMGKMMQTEDLGEGLTAFIEKRPPEWKGR